MDISEHAFETHIVTHLVDAHGYLERRSAEHYDKAACLDWELVLSFENSKWRMANSEFCQQ